MAAQEGDPSPSAAIRIRAALAVVHGGRILLVPHYDTDAGAVQWLVPGGRVCLGETVRAAAAREFEEETGLHADVAGLLDVSEVILPGRAWHSVTLTFAGTVRGGRLAAEEGHRFGRKEPRWFTAAEVAGLACHPRGAVEKALGSGR